MAPVNPVVPVKPVAPVKPVNPVAPVEPVLPVPPVKPGRTSSSQVSCLSVRLIIHTFIAFYMACTLPLTVAGQKRCWGRCAQITHR